MRLDPDDFILADDLLREIMGALAEGHATLVAQSQTPLGTLAVKSATIAVSFDFSVQGRETASGMGLRVRPGSPFGLVPDVQVERLETRLEAINRATVTLEIVNVARPAEVAEEPLGQTADQVQKALDVMLAHVKRVWPKHLEAFREKAEEVRALRADGREDKARKIVAALLADLRAAHQALNLLMPIEVSNALGVLDDWLGAVKSPANAIRAASKARIAGLAGRFESAGLGPSATRAFERATAAALETGREVAATLVLHRAVGDLAAHLPGVVLPVDLLDDLEKLDVLGALETTAGRWRAAFEASARQLQDLVTALPLPARVRAGFEKGMRGTLGSRSAVEAASRLVATLDRLRQDTESLDLPNGVQAALASLQPPGAPPTS